ncbi:TetR/AcrR family transcriptional regulator [Novosphingobium sp. TH158]|uniref:TetR/AcrR family transcriptional regulator n=1 Tax=Novosphingobium sp. TH158 TaxID=2067455 RepID=UPI000C7AB416|nr:TetR/AcrR family transcriptional regulator [Novosphingobium sp. TH158]PLK25649.1 TetR/AcrR family transcriptional regulator [Novosphingobium sp. TH158]
MDELPKRRRRNPEATREEILEAARGILAVDGIEGLSVSAVAEAAGVNRGTAYMHFANREELVALTISSVSEILLKAVYGGETALGDAPVEEIDQVALTENLAQFAMQNPDLCRVWLMQVLASDNPAEDVFWKKYVGSLRLFTETRLAQPGIDAEVLSLIGLAGTFLWPVWAHATQMDEAQRKASAERFSRELLRLSLYGSLVAEHLPAVKERLQQPG